MEATRLSPALALLAGILVFAIQDVNGISSRSRIPTHVLERLKNITNVQELLLSGAVEPPPSGGDVPYSDVIFTREGAVDPGNTEVFADMMDPGDLCSPRPMTVELEPDEDASVVYFPSCVLREQCGGCCMSDTQECAPIQERAEVVNVMKLKFELGSPNFIYDGVARKTVNIHTMCQCRCRIQAHHCIPHKQEYLPDSCRCRCYNHHDAGTCGGLGKIWDETSCACVCPSVTVCAPGENFNFENCRCEARTVGGPGGSSDPCAGLRCRTGYEPVVIGDQCRCTLSTHSVSTGTGTDQGSLPGTVEETPTDPPLPACNMRCRVGYEARRVSGSCRCMRIQTRVARAPVPPVQMAPEAPHWERVPGHPQFHEVRSSRRQRTRYN